MHIDDICESAECEIKSLNLRHPRVCNLSKNKTGAHFLNGVASVASKPKSGVRGDLPKRMINGLLPGSMSLEHH